MGNAGFTGTTILELLGSARVVGETRTKMTLDSLSFGSLDSCWSLPLWRFVVPIFVFDFPLFLDNVSGGNTGRLLRGG